MIWHTKLYLNTDYPWLISYFKWNGKGKDEIILKFAELYIWDYWDISCSWNFLEKLWDVENLIFENMFILVDIPNKHCYHFYVTVNHLSQFIFCTLSMYSIDHCWSPHKQETKLIHCHKWLKIFYPESVTWANTFLFIISKRLMFNFILKPR